MVRCVSLISILLALVLAGCGGGDDDTEGTGGGTTTTQTAPAEPGGGGGGGGDGGGGEGMELFASTCGGCHTLSDAGTSGTFGPNLDELGPDKQRVLNAIRTGPGAMPENLLQGPDADAVATYVSEAAGG